MIGNRRVIYDCSKLPGECLGIFRANVKEKSANCRPNERQWRVRFYEFMEFLALFDGGAHGEHFAPSLMAEFKHPQAPFQENFETAKRCHHFFFFGEPRSRYSTATGGKLVVRHLVQQFESISTERG